jgi:superoxide reductase
LQSRERRQAVSEQALRLGERIQEADWQKEKHVPVIELPPSGKAGDWLQVKVSIGKAIEHPNTTEHHIRWIGCFFSPDSEKFTYDLGRFEFNAHGESVEGPNKGPAYTSHQVIFSFKVTKPGTLHAIALCNIHGLCESDKRVEFSE